ncbi:hypothetical protein Lal_00004928 [Lupinus albus]|nr:hypothetical protein Lal_00004928 [Lupinus albus]
MTQDNLYWLSHDQNRSRIHPKIWLPVPIPKYPQYWIPVPTLVPQKERKRKQAGIASAEFMEGEGSLYKRTSFRCKK